jgi:hypothetical protein
MSWFKYLKDVSSSNFYSPPVKRRLKKIKPVEDIAKDTWFYVDVEGLNLDKKLDLNLESVDDSSSYVVVYEDEVSETSFQPVKSQIVGNRLFFAAAEDHVKNEIIANRYIIYYMANGIKNLSSNVLNGVTRYYLDSTDQADTYVADDEAVDFEYNVELNSNSYYNFSFINSVEPWQNGSSSNVGSSFYTIFSGPTFALRGYRGPDGGKLNVSVTPVDLNASSSNNKSFIIDCYAPSVEENVEIFRTSNLLYQDYKALFTVSGSSNINSSGSYIKINSFSFNYNGYFSVGEELLKDDIKTISIGATTTSSSVVGGVGGGSEIIYNNTYESVDTRDVLIKFWMEVQ